MIKQVDTVGQLDISNMLSSHDMEHFSKKRDFPLIWLQFLWNIYIYMNAVIKRRSFHFQSSHSISRSGSQIGSMLFNVRAKHCTTQQRVT